MALSAEALKALTDPGASPKDIATLLQLRPLGDGRFANVHASPNVRGAVFGGHLLGLSLAAASATVPDARPVSAQQLMFSQSADPERPIELEVSVLQDGKRFASRHVRGTQPADGALAPRRVLDAQVSFAAPLDGPAHAAPMDSPRVDPESLPRMQDVSAEVARAVRDATGYPIGSRDLDLRLAEGSHDLGLGAASAAMDFWIRPRVRMPDDDVRLHAAAFSYLSDWWINFTAVAFHVRTLQREGTRLHVASLNHAVWFHRPFRADDWLCFEVRSPAAASGRGLSVARVFDLEGRLVASVTQENLMTPGDL